MGNRETAREYVLRWAGKPGFPRQQEAITALVDALVNGCADDAHMNLVAEDLEVEAEYCAEPSKVWKCARASDPRLFWKGSPGVPKSKLTMEELAQTPEVRYLAELFGCKPEEVWAGAEPPRAPDREREPDPPCNSNAEIDAGLELAKRATYIDRGQESTADHRKRAERNRLTGECLGSVAATEPYKRWLKKNFG